jgi:type I restriction enzyme R subunit
MERPEQEARKAIDAALAAAGWEIQDPGKANVHAARGVAIREFPLKTGHGFADYLLYVDGKAAGIVEAKKVGTTLTGVEVQTRKYSDGMPSHLPRAWDPLPFLYQSTGVETRFTDRLDPEPRSRPVFSFHRPETLAKWLEPAEELPAGHPLAGRPANLRARLQHLPELASQGLWGVQSRAVLNLERSLRENRPRALIQMATGSGKTFTAITSAYRLIKFGGARRVLFLVDRGNLGRQALKEFQQYTAPDDGRKFNELYNVQHLTSNKLDPVARVTISTIQRLYSMLSGEEPEGLEDLEEKSLYTLDGLVRERVPVAYNPRLPIETFDVIFVDECHRSIYTLWRQVVEYFDAFLIGLTATPSKQTFGFFHKNLVMEYSHAEAVADGVNVDYDVYRIRTRITEQGSTVEAGHFLDRRDRHTRAVRWERLDEDFTYGPAVLDRDVVAVDQIRTVIRAFKERLFTEIFPGRTEVPKTLIYAKDDTHADDIVQIVREEFGKGDEFAQKITYRTPGKAEDLIGSFRTRYHPRIAVTVDMIATGTDIKPIEIVMFLRTVKSRNYFEQMKGRGVRVIPPTDLQSATPDAGFKDHFVIVDCVGVCEGTFSESYSLDRQPTASFDSLLNAVGFGSLDPDLLSSLASRLSRLDRRLGQPDRDKLAAVAGGRTLRDIVHGLVEALDPDRQAEEARRAANLSAGTQPNEAEMIAAAQRLLAQAAAPLATNPGLREEIVAVRRRHDQVIDVVSIDEVREVGFSREAQERAENLVGSFEQFIQDHLDEITALQVLFSRPHHARLSHREVKELAEILQSPPRSWTPERLWQAYEMLGKDKVRGAGGPRLLTDIVSLVRYALTQEDELVPFKERVEERFRQWIAQQANGGRVFTAEQMQWLEAMKDHIAGNLQMEMDDFEYVPFSQRGGAPRALAVFGEELEMILDELNEVLAA